MFKKTLTGLLAAAFICGSLVFSQVPLDEENKIYIRAVVYPTFSLSRFDYNNDLNNSEIRAHVNLSWRSPHGEIIPDAEVKVNGRSLEFTENNYEKRIQVSPEALPDKITLDIKTRSGINFSQTYSIPDWLVIREPSPSIVDHNSDLNLKWAFKNFRGLVNIRAYDFNTGDEILRLSNVMPTETVIPAADIQEDNLLRIYVICSWMYKKYIRGENIARGSEINMIPWSQVFIRTK